jgi:hypothetical protein
VWGGPRVDEPQPPATLTPHTRAHCARPSHPQLCARPAPRRAPACWQQGCCNHSPCTLLQPPPPPTGGEAAPCQANGRLPASGSRALQPLSVHYHNPTATLYQVGRRRLPVPLGQGKDTCQGEGVWGVPRTAAGAAARAPCKCTATPHNSAVQFPRGVHYLWSTCTAPYHPLVQSTLSWKRFIFCSVLP